MNSACQLHKQLISTNGAPLSRHYELYEQIDSELKNHLLGIGSFLNALGICRHPQTVCSFPVSYAFKKYAFSHLFTSNLIFLMPLAGILISIFLSQRRNFLWLS
jgi:hypothetical protein